MKDENMKENSKFYIFSHTHEYILSSPMNCLNYKTINSIVGDKLTQDEKLQVNKVCEKVKENYYTELEKKIKSKRLKYTLQKKMKLLSEFQIIKEILEKTNMSLNFLLKIDMFLKAKNREEFLVKYNLLKKFKEKNALIKQENKNLQSQYKKITDQIKL